MESQKSYWQKKAREKKWTLSPRFREKLMINKTIGTCLKKILFLHLSEVLWKLTEVKRHYFVSIWKFK